MMGKSDKVKQDKVAQLEILVRDLEEKWKRALADYQNLEKRVESRRQEVAAFAAKGLILKLLPVGDTLNLAARHLKDQGLDLAIGHFRQILESEGLEKIETEGKDFDPNEMECVEVVEGENEGKVAEEVRAGYLLEGKVLRVAQVKVFKKQITEKTGEN
ncbi:MAG: nucleotide exchange factor GrpE [bacterium]|nr:nucleotide exchange factor GrpE [bacterium]